MKELSTKATRLGTARPGVAFATRMLGAFVLCAGLNGCVVVGASSRGGFFLWPGGLGLLAVVVVFVLLLRRR